MKCCTAFLLIVAAGLAIAAAQQPKGFGVSLCLDIFGGGCENKNNPISINEEAERNPLLVLRNGFKEFSDKVFAAQNEALDGFSQANETAEQAIQDSEDILYDGGSLFFYSLGKALALSNDGARKGLVEASQKIQTIGLNILNEMRIAKALAIQERNIAGNAEKQANEAIRLILQVAFAPVDGAIKLSLKRATEAIEYAQSNPSAKTVVHRNAYAATQDSDARVAISDIYNSAVNSMRRGASESEVTRLREAFTNSIVDVAEIALNLRRNFAKIEKLSFDNDLTLATNEFLKDCEDATKSFQEIFSNICLDFGSVGANLSHNQIQNVFLVLEHGNEELTHASEIAKEKILSVLKNKGTGVLLDAAVQIFKYGKVALYEKIAEAATILFNIL